MADPTKPKQQFFQKYPELAKQLSDSLGVEVTPDTDFEDFKGLVLASSLLQGGSTSDRRFSVRGAYDRAESERSLATSGSIAERLATGSAGFEALKDRRSEVQELQASGQLDAQGRVVAGAEAVQDAAPFSTASRVNDILADASNRQLNQQLAFSRNPKVQEAIARRDATDSQNIINTGVMRDQLTGAIQTPQGKAVGSSTIPGSSARSSTFNQKLSEALTKGLASNKSLSTRLFTLNS